MKFLHPGLVALTLGYVLSQFYRAFLAVLDGSCRTPIAGYATLEGEGLRLRGLVLRPDGREAVDVTLSGDAADAERIGREAGHDIGGRLPHGWGAG